MCARQKHDEIKYKQTVIEAAIAFCVCFFEDPRRKRQKKPWRLSTNTLVTLCDRFDFQEFQKQILRLGIEESAPKTKKNNPH